MCLAIPGREVDVVDEGNRLAGVDLAGVRCITCGDVGVEMRVVEFEAAPRIC